MVNDDSKLFKRFRHQHKCPGRIPTSTLYTNTCTSCGETLGRKYSSSLSRSRAKAKPPSILRAVSLHCTTYKRRGGCVLCGGKLPACSAGWLSGNYSVRTFQACRTSSPNKKILFITLPGRKQQQPSGSIYKSPAYCDQIEENSQSHQIRIKATRIINRESERVEAGKLFVFVRVCKIDFIVGEEASGRVVGRENQNKGTGRKMDEFNVNVRPKVVERQRRRSKSDESELSGCV